MSGSIKLTTPQRDTLWDISDNAPNAVPMDERYKPAVRLVELGFATWKDQRFGGNALSITLAGKRWLDPEALDGAPSETGEADRG